MKKLLATSLVFSMFLSAGSFAASMGDDQGASFPDVPSDHENAEAIAWLKAEGVVQGYTDGNYKPEKLVNRAEFLKMLYETIGMEGHEPVLSFPDVPANEWYTKYVKEAFYTKVAVGYDDGYFRPDNNINFVEAVKVVMNGFFDVDDLYGDGSDYTPCDDTSHDYNGDLTKFGGIDTTAWYWKYLYVADGMCILNFDHAANASVAYYASYDPGIYITRADMAELLYRAHNEQAKDMEGDGMIEADDSSDGDGTNGGVGGSNDSAEVDIPLELTVNYIADGGDVPVKYTCDNPDMNMFMPYGDTPGFSFSNVPDKAVNMAIIVSDPDAPGGTFYHAVLWNIDPNSEMPEAEIPSGDVKFGTNDGDTFVWFGPCPPEGDGPHHYVFTLYALDDALETLESGATAQELLAAMEGHILETDTVTGLYERGGNSEVKNMSLTVQTINDNELINKKYTCDSGDSQFPNGQPLGYSFFDVPQSAESLAIIASDPDAPGGTFYHGVLWNIPAVAESLPEGMMLPPDVQVGINDSGSSAPFGPCPPEGDGIHHYIFTLYALDLVFKADDLHPETTTARDLLDAMESHILETATVTGLYER